ncbi:MAG: M14 metallopeptidase family protein, partial [Gemmatimonadota bacterium]
IRRTLAWGSTLTLLALCLAGPSSLSGQRVAVPTPESVLGYTPGADFHLADYKDALAYFRRLDEASDMVQLVEVGRTTSGQPWYIAVISSAENLRNLDRYREISFRLAHPEGLSNEEARALAREGKAIVHIDGAVHASEVAAHQHTIQLAYDLLTGEDDPEIRAILDNVIFMLWPTLNPDGQTMVAEWYLSNVGTPYETSPLPELYQEYVGHDNNRDAYMLNMVESRVIGRTWREWEPQIVFVHHQTAPFPTRIWLPPFDEPVGSRVHPLMARTVNTLGMLMAQALEERGQVGATHMGVFDAWYPGYIDYLPMLQNAAAFWTETALYSYATPRFYTPADVIAGGRDLRPQSLYSSPWPGGWWRLRDAVEYMETASIAVLDFAAKFKDDLLYNRYQAGRDAIQRYSEGPPYAYFIPQEQRDPVAPVELLRRLAFNGIRVFQLERSVVHEGTTHAAGSWVIPMDQEFAELVRTLLEVQEYPDLREYEGGPPKRPYDVSGWTLPYQFGVRVVEASEPLTPEIRSALAPVRGETLDWRTTDEMTDGADAALFDSPPGLGFNSDTVAAGIVPLPGSIRGGGSAIAVSPSQNNAFRAVNRAWKGGATVRFEPGAAQDGNPDSGGRFVISGLGGAAAQNLVRELGLRAEGAGSAGQRLAPPRIGLFRPWQASMDEGWTRWLLERYGFDIISLRNADIRAGSLSDRLDVIILADYGARTILEGHGEGSIPPRFAGGIGAEGVRALDEFVSGGGTLVCLNGSSQFAIDELGLPVRNVAAGLRGDEFSISGSILEILTDPSHPVMAGMPSRAPVFFSRSPVFTTTEGFEGVALAKYVEAGSSLLSGYLLGEEYLHGYAAALDVHHGDGHVILLGFKPQWRGQPFGSLRALFNAALFHGPHADEAKGANGFWTPPEKEGEGG